MAIAFKHPLSYNLARHLKTLTNQNNSQIHFENNDEYLHRNKQKQLPPIALELKRKRLDFIAILNNSTRYQAEPGNQLLKLI